MNTKPALRIDPAVSALASKIAVAIYDEKGLSGRAYNKRIESGIALLALKTILDEDRSRADGMTFWEFFDYSGGFGISRREAEKRIVTAKSENPEDADRQRQEANRQHQAAYISRNEDEENQEDSRGQLEEECEAQPTREGVADLLVEQVWATLKRMSRNQQREILERLEKAFGY